MLTNQQDSLIVAITVFPAIPQRYRTSTHHFAAEFRGRSVASGIGIVPIRVACKQPENTAQAEEISHREICLRWVPT